MLFFAAAQLPGRAFCDEEGFMAGGRRAFPVLLADPHEPHFSAQAVWPVSQKVWGDVSLGEYVSLYKHALQGPARFLQLLVGGGVFSRFDLLKTTKDLQVSDYTANLPVELRWDRWSSRLVLYHISSHLGDDYILETGQTRTKYAVDSVKGLCGYDVARGWRLYGGYNFVLRHVGTEHERHAVMGGFEYESRLFGRRRELMAYWANDFQSWERSAWNPQFQSQLGLRLRRSETEPQGMAVFMEFGTGARPFGQFHEQHETRWGLGLRFFFEGR